MPTRKYFDYCRTMTQNNDIKIITKKQLAEMLEVSPSTIYRMLQGKLLPPPLRTPKGYIQGWLHSTIEQWKVDRDYYH